MNEKNDIFIEYRNQLDNLKGEMSYFIKLSEKASHTHKSRIGLATRKRSIKLRELLKEFRKISLKHEKLLKEEYEKMEYTNILKGFNLE